MKHSYKMTMLHRSAKEGCNNSKVIVPNFFIHSFFDIIFALPS